MIDSTGENVENVSGRGPGETNFAQGTGCCYIIGQNIPVVVSSNQFQLVKSRAETQTPLGLPPRNSFLLISITYHITFPHKFQTSRPSFYFYSQFTHTYIHFTVYTLTCCPEFFNSFSSFRSYFIFHIYTRFVYFHLITQKQLSTSILFLVTHFLYSPILIYLSFFISSPLPYSQTHFHHSFIHQIHSLKHFYHTTYTLCVYHLPADTLLPHIFHR